MCKPLQESRGASLGQNNCSCQQPCTRVHLKFMPGECSWRVERKRVYFGSRVELGSVSLMDHGVRVHDMHLSPSHTHTLSLSSCLRHAPRQCEHWYSVRGVSEEKRQMTLSFLGFLSLPAHVYRYTHSPVLLSLSLSLFLVVCAGYKHHALGIPKKESPLLSQSPTLTRSLFPKKIGTQSVVQTQFLSFFQVPYSFQEQVSQLLSFTYKESRCVSRASHPLTSCHLIIASFAKSPANPFVDC